MFGSMVSDIDSIIDSVRNTTKEKRFMDRVNAINMVIYVVVWITFLIWKVTDDIKDIKY